MQIGSLIVCVDAKGLHDRVLPLVENKIYIVRDIFETDGEIGITLEEIINGLYLDGEEFGYAIERFRELDTPVSICLDEILELEMV